MNCGTPNTRPAAESSRTALPGDVRSSHSGHVCKPDETLARLVELWPKLSADVRHALAVMAEHALPGDRPTAPVRLLPIDREILTALRPDRAQVAADLNASADRSAVWRRLCKLERAGLVARPLGKNSGWIITPAGEAVLYAV